MKYFERIKKRICIGIKKPGSALLHIYIQRSKLHGRYTVGLVFNLEGGSLLLIGFLTELLLEMTLAVAVKLRLVLVCTKRFISWSVQLVTGYKGGTAERMQQKDAE
jgi:hypothetical protein